MKVIQMARYRSRTTVAVLEALLEKALAGEIVGIAACYRLADGFEDSAITGVYLENPDSAASSALRLSMRLAGAKGEYRRSP